jgi:hypothetical protein
MADINYSKERFLKLILAEQVDSERLRANREQTATELVSRIKNLRGAVSYLRNQGIELPDDSDGQKEVIKDLLITGLGGSMILGSFTPRQFIDILNSRASIEKGLERIGGDEKAPEEQIYTRGVKSFQDIGDELGVSAQMAKKIERSASDKTVARGSSYEEISSALDAAVEKVGSKFIEDLQSQEIYDFLTSLEIRNTSDEDIEFLLDLKEMDEESALEELTRKYDADAPLRSVQKFDLMVRKELNPERRGRPRKADGTESSDED